MAFKEIQQPRSNYQIERFVVGEKDTPIAAYCQCVLEMQIKHQVIRRAVIGKRKLEIEIDRLRASGDEIDDLTAQEKEIDIEATDHAMLGALREFACLYSIFRSFNHVFTHQEIQVDQTQYWHKRLIRQAQQDLQSSGRIGVGNMDALRQAGITGWDDKGKPVLAEVNNGVLDLPRNG